MTEPKLSAENDVNPLVELIAKVNGFHRESRAGDGLLIVACTCGWQTSWNQTHCSGEWRVHHAEQVAEALNAHTATEYANEVEGEGIVKRVLVPARMLRLPASHSRVVVTTRALYSPWQPIPTDIQNGDDDA
jgi:hypothetical protein